MQSISHFPPLNLEIYSVRGQNVEAVTLVPELSAFPIFFWTFFWDWNPFRATSPKIFLQYFSLSFQTFLWVWNPFGISFFQKIQPFKQPLPPTSPKSQGFTILQKLIIIALFLYQMISVAHINVYKYFVCIYHIGTLHRQSSMQSYVCVNQHFIL